MQITKISTLKRDIGIYTGRGCIYRSLIQTSYFWYQLKQHSFPKMITTSFHNFPLIFIFFLDFFCCVHYFLSKVTITKEFVCIFSKGQFNTITVVEKFKRFLKLSLSSFVNLSFWLNQVSKFFLLEIQVMFLKIIRSFLDWLTSWWFSRIISTYPYKKRFYYSRNASQWGNKEPLILIIILKNSIVRWMT